MTYIQVYYLGSKLCFHPGIVHGGVLATLLDECLVRCCAPFLPHQIAMTAQLNISFRAPVNTEQYVLVRAQVLEIEGRKARVQGTITPFLSSTTGASVVLAEASALFISPNHDGLVF